MYYIANNSGLHNQFNQRGAVLILSMVILLIMTLIGTANMQSAGLQQKMAANAKARQEAFQYAESTLRFAESKLQASYSPGLSDRVLITNCAQGDATCFESSCSGGLCFLGTLDTIAQDKSQCSLSSTAGANTNTAAYLNKTIWEDNSRHQKAVGILGAQSDLYESETKYIIEFMCYVRKSETQDCVTGGGASCSPLFRATALVERKGASARVMLSSLFRL